MDWNEVLREVSVLECAGGPTEVTGVQYDSRRVGPGDLFVAMCGGSADGNRYVDVAIAQGAAAVVTDSREAYATLRGEHPELAVALVERGRRALAEASSAVMGHPQKKLALSGGDGHEWEDDDGVSAGGDAAERGAAVRADRDD